MMIKCDQDDCQQVYPFNETLSHRKICSVKKTSCTNNCGDGNLYKGVDAMLKHVIEECIKSMVICKRCKTKCAREDFNGHDCAIGFINQVKSGDAESYKAALSEIQVRFDAKVLVL